MNYLAPRLLVLKMNLAPRAHHIYRVAWLNFQLGFWQTFVRKMAKFRRDCKVRNFFRQIESHKYLTLWIDLTKKLLLNKIPWKQLLTNIKEYVHIYIDFTKYLIQFLSFINFAGKCQLSIYLCCFKSAFFKTFMDSSTLVTSSMSSSTSSVSVWVTLLLELKTGLWLQEVPAVRVE